MNRVSTDLKLLLYSDRCINTFVPTHMTNSGRCKLLTAQSVCGAKEEILKAKGRRGWSRALMQMVRSSGGAH